MSEPSETETVGYKRPPSKTQFKPGQSGNPRGRPKRKVDMSESLNRALDEKIVVTELGKGADRYGSVRSLYSQSRAPG